MKKLNQLTKNDYNVIVNYFMEIQKNTGKGFLDPYTNKETEFGPLVIKNNLLNWRALYYSDDAKSEMIYFRLRKKPYNSLIVDLIYFDFSIACDSVNKLNPVFIEIKSKYDWFNKVNICLLENDINKIKIVLNKLNFLHEVTHYDEFGLGNNVLVYSRYL